MARNVQHTKATRVELLPALRRHWFVALLPVVVFVAGAIVLGLARPVNYTTTANLSVGHVYVANPAGIPSIIEATRSLASALQPGSRLERGSGRTPDGDSGSAPTGCQAASRPPPYPRAR